MILEIDLFSDGVRLFPFFCEGRLFLLCLLKIYIAYQNVIIKDNFMGKLSYTWVFLGMPTHDFVAVGWPSDDAL